ncbi:hypothetical protein A2J03_25185 [Rhodococcus sp. EPR-157]|nr:hypothetical protein A2J03_25185 [Rhodococcus sp. EPR-157]
MKNHLRASVAGILLAAVIPMSGCSVNSEQRVESFEFSGPRLDVVNSNAHMPVIAAEQPGSDEVVVTVQTESMVKSATTPAWSLDGTSLNLGTPCGEGIVGYCEGSYSIVVPAGTEVYVNGAPVTSR